MPNGEKSRSGKLSQNSFSSAARSKMPQNSEKLKISLQGKFFVAFSWNKTRILLSKKKTGAKFFMSQFTNLLNNVKIASPCSRNWDEMAGDERARFCGECKLQVYNLSGMSRREAENLIFQSEGNRVCVRFFRRADGTIMTKDCPVGWRAIKRNISKIATAFASLVFTALGAIGLTNYLVGSTERGTEVGAVVLPVRDSQIESPPNRYAAMGAMANKNTVADVKGKSLPTMGKVAVEKNNQASVERNETIKAIDAAPQFLTK